MYVKRQHPIKQGSSIVVSKESQTALSNGQSDLALHKGMLLVSAL